ncbi:MAG TPA: lysophospholipid acyltransferase family protein [Candidatus Binatia bacterium]|jgi:KDO2-lipid IV(A) lauroyltransferase|nr:lysophospholipid acyltransferase family protein [Candidatus Binatia bacterium]
MAQPKSRTPVGLFFYRLRYRIGEHALRALVGLFPWVPYRLLVLFTSFCARVAFGLLWRYRRRMLENISMALGAEITRPAERKALIGRAWQNFARGVLDTCAVMHFSKEKIRSTIALEGEEHLKSALAKGRGVLALSAHLGGFTLIGARLGASGYAFSAVVKQPGEERFARYLDDLRAQIGIRTISAKPRKEAVRGILKALRQNCVVLVIADEFKSGGVMVDFLGQIAPAPRGPATLALRTGAVTLPMFATRGSDGSFQLSIGPEIEPVRLDDLEKSVTATTALFTRHLEAAIRRYPEQWNWLGFPRNGKILRPKYQSALSISADSSRAAPD